VLTHEEIEDLLRNVSTTTLRRSRAGVRHALSIPAVRALAYDERLIGIARKVLGNGATPFRATLFNKLPGSNWLVSWHQDTALPLAKRIDVFGWGPWSVKEGVTYAHAPASALENILALRIHLDESTALNAPLRVLPRTHALGVLNDEAVLHLAATDQSYECLVPQGGVLAMRPLIIHASSKSQIEAPRRVLHIEYAASLTLPEGLELALA